VFVIKKSLFFDKDKPEGN